MKACFHFSWMKFIHKCGSGRSNHKQAAAPLYYYRNNNWIPNPPPCVVLLYEILATAFLNYIFYYYLIIFICHGIRRPVWVDTVFKIVVCATYFHKVTFYYFQNSVCGLKLSLWLESSTKEVHECFMYLLWNKAHKWCLSFVILGEMDFLEALFIDGSNLIVWF